MRNLVILFIHVMATLTRLLGPGGIRSVVAESVLAKQQLLILNRSRQRSPNLRTSDRLVAGLCALLIRPARRRCCVIRARGVGLRVLTGQGTQIDTTTATPPCPRSAPNLGSPPWRSTGTSGRKASCASKARRFSPLESVRASADGWA